MTRPCPRCGRGNAAHKASCLYCGAALPEPALPPPPAARELPADLDSLVADALSGRGIQRLKAALLAVPAPAPPQEESITVTPLTDALPVAPSLDPAPVEAPGASDLPAALDRATEALDRLRRLSGEEAHRAATALIAAAAEIQRLLPALEAAPPEAEALPIPVALPAVRLSYALVIDGLNAADRAPELASALGTDLATARLLAGSPCVRVATRSANPDPLRASATRLRAHGIGASVIAREAVSELPHPILVVSARSQEAMRGVSAGPLWEGDPEQVLSVRGDPLQDPSPMLAVLGEVVVVRARTAAERSKMLRAASADARRTDERRLGVIDLWAEGLHLRLVEGLTRVDAPEGRAPFRAFVEGLAARFPGVHVEPRRICRPDERVATSHPGETVAQSGWPAWDEHTRMVWLHRQAQSAQIP